MKPKKHNLKRINNFLLSVDWAFELNNFSKTIEKIEVQPKNYPDLAAEATPDMTYKEIIIRLYPLFWKLSLEEQRKALLHELVHTLIQETKMIASGLLDGTFHSEMEIKRINEKAVSSITHLLDGLLTGNLRYFIKAYKKYILSKPKQKK